MDLAQEVIIIGAGQAGLSASYFLQKEKVKHLVFEGNKIGFSWISQRWDSFKMNTPNWMTSLPGADICEEQREDFMSRDEFVSYLKKYVNTFQLPVQEGYKVVNLQIENKKFVVTTTNNGQQLQWRAKAVIIASGMMNKIKLPYLSQLIPQNILQLHASAYKNPEQLPQGNILIVGGAQSGCQIAEELALSGKKVYMASSKVPRTPRRYRGRDVMEWLNIMGVQDITAAQLQQNPKLNATQPQSSGMGQRGHTISYQSLNRIGVKILGSLKEIKDDCCYFEDNAKEHIHFADQTSTYIKNSIDEFLKDHPEIIHAGAEPDDADLPDKASVSASDIVRLFLPDEYISTVIWATGFGYDFSYIDSKVCDKMEKPKHFEGKIISGLYCVGFPWLRKKKSGLVFGAGEDAQKIVQQLLEEIN